MNGQFEIVRINLDIKEDGTGTQTDKAKMISFDNFSDAVNYNGKEVKVKITSMFWPSDTSLPLLEPYALEGEYEIVE